MADERLLELQEKLFNLERKIKPLEWDLSRNQINEFKKGTLIKLKEEFGTLQSELESLQKLD
ncbi:MAG: hypothetical protein ABIH82_02690 [Candidatus Woesearchaeota archaeon]